MSKNEKLGQLKSLPNDFLKCRAYVFHPFDTIGYYNFTTYADTRRSGVCVISQCVRCGTRREDYFMRSGRLVGRRYVHPEGYLLDGDGFVTHEQIIAEMLRRAPVQGNVSELTDDSYGKVLPLRKKISLRG